MIIAIDGPAGSGKSTTAQEVARRLGFLHLDSGSLYRAFALAACRIGWAGPAGDVAAERIHDLSDRDVDVEVVEGRVKARLDGVLLGAEIRTPEVTACASKASAFPEIRARVDQLLRDLAARYDGGIVCEGRDMGTVVFPGAELKVFMDASAEERARRRLLQRGDPVTPEGVEIEADRLLARDRDDSLREVSPLRKAAEAVVIDTTDLDFEEQVEEIVAAARRILDTP
jgi:cytidylate kinase